MKKWIIIFVICELILIGVVVLYQYAGLKYYVKAVNFIHRLNGAEKNQVSEEFSGISKGLYSGILAGVWKGKLTGIWIWSRYGLRFFRTDQYSIYSFYDGCIAPIIDKKIPRLISFNIEEWASLVKVGDFIEIMVANKENGGTIGNLREVWGYNFWIFMHKTMDQSCIK